MEVNVFGFKSEYTKSLEKRVEKLEKEREDLLNRLLHAYSGYELRHPVPSYFEAQNAQPAANKAPTGDEVIGKGIHSTFDLLQELENATLQESEGIPDITVKVAREQAVEENERAAKEMEDEIIRNKKVSGIN